MAAHDGEHLQNGYIEAEAESGKNGSGGGRENKLKPAVWQEEGNQHPHAQAGSREELAEAWLKGWQLQNLWKVS
jgi:hypothetical protein